jgi:GNAT superfamily N-acetyltransferase
MKNSCLAPIFRPRTSWRIELLADHPEHVEPLARWHSEEEPRPDDPGWLDFWRRQLSSESRRDEIPIAFVAIDGGQPVGGVSLVHANMRSHRELSPWLAGTLVHRSRRGEGIGSALVEHAVERARGLGVPRLYLYTERARGLYERAGFHHLWDEVYEGNPVAVMAIDL